MMFGKKAGTKPGSVRRALTTAAPGRHGDRGRGWRGVRHGGQRRWWHVELRGQQQHRLVGLLPRDDLPWLDVRGYVHGPCDQPPGRYVVDH
jgi:hypothetical protein